MTPLFSLKKTEYDELRGVKSEPKRVTWERDSGF